MRDVSAIHSLMAEKLWQPAFHLGKFWDLIAVTGMKVKGFLCQGFGFFGNKIPYNLGRFLLLASARYQEAHQSHFLEIVLKSVLSLGSSPLRPSLSI